MLISGKTSIRTAQKSNTLTKMITHNDDNESTRIHQIIGCSNASCMIEFCSPIEVTHGELGRTVVHHSCPFGKHLRITRH